MGLQASLEIYVRTYVLGLPRRKVCEVQKVLDEQLLQGGNIPSRTGVLFRDLVRFRIHLLDMALTVLTNQLVMTGSSKSSSTVNLPSLLHNKPVLSTIPPCIGNTPPTVSYQYTNSIASNVFIRGLYQK